MKEELIRNVKVAEMLGLSVNIVRQAHNENSSSYRPLFPKPFKYQVMGDGSKFALWLKKDILAYQEECKRNPLAKLTRRRFEKASDLMLVGSLRSKFDTKAEIQQRHERRKRNNAKNALFKALRYASAATLIQMLQEMDFE